MLVGADVVIVGAVQVFTGSTTMVVSSVQRPQLRSHTWRSSIQASSQVPHSTHWEHGKSGSSSLMLSVHGTTTTSGSGGTHSTGGSPASGVVGVGPAVDAAGSSTGDTGGATVAVAPVELDPPGGAITGGGAPDIGPDPVGVPEGIKGSTVCSDGARWEQARPESKAMNAVVVAVLDRT